MTDDKSEKTLSGLVKDFQGYDAKIEQAQKSVQALILEKSNIKNELAEAIRAGETTGDRINDYVLVQINPYQPNFVDFYREIDTRVKACQGQRVLLMGIKKVPADHTGDHRTFGHTEGSIFLGIINKDELIFDLTLKPGWKLYPDVFIPTDGYIKATLPRDDIQKMPGNLCSDTNYNVYIRNFVNVTTEPMTVLEEKDWNITLKIGDAAVDDLLNQSEFSEYLLLVDRMTRELLKLV